MAKHQKWNKIHALHKTEVADILNGVCIIQEKIDGANTSIWLDDNGNLTCGSRTKTLGLNGGFNGFCDWVRESEAVKRFFENNPTKRLNGEWLVKHTIDYNATAYKQFYLFDITDTESHFGNNTDREFRIPQEAVAKIAEEYGFNYPEVFAILENPTLEDVQAIVGRSALGERGEGVVIKNETFVNKFGDSPYAKLVTEKFKEDNGVAFGGNNKYSDTYEEMYICNKYMTLPRVKKVMQKLRPELGKFEMKHIPRIMETAMHDLITEEAWEIFNKGKKIDFSALKRICNKKAKQIYIDILNDSISVADKDGRQAIRDSIRLLLDDMQFLTEEEKEAARDKIKKLREQLDDSISAADKDNEQTKN